MKKKRIAIFGVKYFPSRGGTSRVVEHLLWELGKEYDITIYCYKNEKAGSCIPGIKTVRFPEIPVKGFGVFLYYLCCCLHLLWKGRYDLVHAHKLDCAFFLPFLGLKFNVAATAHALPYLNEKWSWPAKGYFKIAEYFFLNAGASLSTVSKSHLTHFGKKASKEIRYIPNGVVRSQELKPELADALLAEHGIRPGYLFFAARRLIPLKGCHTLIESLRQLDYKGTLVIAGDMSQLPDYTQRLKTLSEGLDVCFIGYVSDMGVLNALIHRSSFFVFPSELEAMSMMLLEVGAIGTPMICSDIPQNKAVLGEEEVLFFESENADDLSGKLNWAFENPDLMKARAGKARMKIEEQYSIGAVAAKYRQWYEEIAFSQPPQTANSKA